MYYLAITLFFLATHSQTFYSTAEGNTIINVCHCDKIKGFCDYYCCCDPDCSATVINQLKRVNFPCENNSILSYCLDDSYFYNVNVNPTSKTVGSNGTTCYDFNNTVNDQTEITLTTSMVESIVAQYNPANIGVTQQYYSAGYSETTPILTANNQLIDINGKCSTSGVTQSTPTISLNFGIDRSITCSTSSAIVCIAKDINLFKSFKNQNIKRFLNEPEMGSFNVLQNISFENSSPCLTSLTLVIFYSQMGTQMDQLYYIVDTRSIEDYSSNLETYTFSVKFVNYDVISKKQNAGSISGAPFFPMIPQDMFYPLIYSKGQIVVTTIILLFGLVI